MPALTHESERLEELKRYPLLDTPPEASFDRITRLAARLFRVPIVLLVFFDGDRQWLKSSYGNNVCRTEPFAVPCEEVLVVQDTSRDLRFRTHPLATQIPELRFYAGAPLRTLTGHTLGTLCVIDHNPREFSAEEQTDLRDLAALVMDEVGLRHSSQNLQAGEHAEEALRQAETTYRILVENSSDIVAIVDETGVLRFVSPSIERVLGTRPSALIGQLAFDYIHPDDCPRVQSTLSSIVQEGEQTSQPQRKSRADRFRWRHQDGTWHVLEAVGTNWLTNSGINGVVINARDITQLLASEAALKESEDRFKSAFSRSSVGLALVAPDGRWLLVNQRLCEILGYSEAELLERTFQDLTYPDDLQLDLQFAQELLRGEKNTYQFEKRYFHKDGHLVWALLNVSLVRNAHGEPQYFISQVQDITDRKGIEQQLEAERAKLSYLFTHAPAYVVTLRGPEHIFELANPAYLRMIGRTDVIGKSIREVLPELVEQGFLDLMNHVYQTGEPYRGDEVLCQVSREPGGPLEDLFFNYVYQPIKDTNGIVTGIFGHAIDITEQVRARRDAEAANRAKDEFLATLSHELRTPLNAILGWSRLLGEGRLDEESQTHAIGTIQRNAELQVRLIEDILDVSRIITGKLRLDVQPVQLSVVIEAAIETLIPAAQAKDIRIQRVLDSGADFVMGDHQRLQQVVWNLLSNSIKFTPAGGQVQVHLERIKAQIKIVVSDTGVGVPADVLPYVFDRFRQADSTSTRQFGGLGLGLAIVRHITELHGGTVTVESAGAGQGATFTVSLPLARISSAGTTPDRPRVSSPQSKPPEIAFSCPPELKGLHVLVVDDEPDVRDLVRTLLEKCGAKVTTADAAAPALRAIQDLCPDVLLSDLGMPEEDGYDLIQKIRALPVELGGNIPAAALTAYARTEDRIRVLQAGFQMHVAKPVEPDDLIAVVANLGGRGNVSVESEQP